MGGGNSPSKCLTAKPRGLSPRGRGKPLGLAVVVDVVGSIPAWAGETKPAPSPIWASRVYPRVGGGNHRYGGDVREKRGLSPRGRGKLSMRDWRILASRSIPAWAGETYMMRRILRFERVYPRVGGGNPFLFSWAPLLSGLSPRGRGKQFWLSTPQIPARSIPAWAGETINNATPPESSEVYPRVGGGND